MIAMSDDFKKSISSTEREIKGYVEVTYSNSNAKDNAIVTDSPLPLIIGNEYVNLENIIDNDRKGKNYASLEQDYFQLNGTFVLPNNKVDKNPGIGFVSNELFEEELENKPFQISTELEENETINGITMYFVNNKPLDLEVQIISGEDTETFTNIDITDNGVATLIFSDRTIDTIKIYVNDVLYPNRRIRLQEVDFGISAIYENEDLISFNTIEQISRFNTEMPINECVVEIGDFKGQFDKANNTNITQYLGNNVLIKPYVGVVTNESGIEYCLMGTFWLDNYDYDGKICKLNGKDVLNKYNFLDYQVISSSAFNIRDIIREVKKVYNININNKVENPDHYIKCYNNNGIYQSETSPFYRKYDTFTNNLLKTAIILGNTFNSNRYGEIDYIDTINNISYIKINNDVMKEYQEIKAIEPIKTFKYTVNYYVNDESQDNVTFLSENRQCNGITKIVYEDDKQKALVKIIIDCDDYSKLNIIYATCEVYDKNNKLIYNGENYSALKYIPIVFEYNGTIKIRMIGHIIGTINYQESEINYQDTGIEYVINNDYMFNSKYDVLSTYDYNYLKIPEYIINNKSKYSSKFKFNGNPIIECGDCIEVQQKYDNLNYDKLFITKIESEFKGSFNQSIEGDIIEK